MHARAVAEEATPWALRVVYGPGAAKRIARSHGVSVATAKAWLAGRLVPARPDRLARIKADMAAHRAELEEAERMIDRLCAPGSPGR